MLHFWSRLVIFSPGGSASRLASTTSSALCLVMTAERSSLKPV